MAAHLSCRLTPITLALLGLALVSAPRTTHADPAPPAAKRGAPPTILAPVPGNPVSFLDVPGGDVHALMDDGSIRNLADGMKVMQVADSDPDWSIENVICAAAEGPRFACLYVGTRTEGQGQSSYTHRKLVWIESNGKRNVIASGGGDKYSVTGLGIHLHGDSRAFQEQTVASKEQTVASKEQTVASKEQTVASKEQTVASKEQTVASKEQTVAVEGQTAWVEPRQSWVN